jgi:glycosyltransferase involved in cell wall biosynthesis
MRILFVADVSISEVIGGAERVLREETCRLAQKGHEVRVLTRRLPEHESSKERVAGVEEIRYRFQPRPLPLAFKSILFNCSKTFGSLQRKTPTQIVNLHQPFSGLGVLPSLSGRSLPLIYTCLSFSFEEYISRSSQPNHQWGGMNQRLQVFSRKLLEKILLNRSDHIVVLSEYTRNRIQQVYGLSESKMSLIHGGVDLERFKPATDKESIRIRLGLPRNCTILLTVRNLVPRMGLENLINGFKNLLRDNRDLFLVIGGEGSLRTSLEEQAKKERVADSTRFVGFIPEDELADYYRMADVFVLPTRELEGFGLVTIEALASGLPVLGTPVGGTKEILSKLGRNFLFDDFAPESIAKGIQTALDDWVNSPNAYNRVSQACRALAEQHYSWEAHINQLEELFSQFATSHQ